MRIRLRKHHGTEASVLFVTLGLASLLILFMYYYLNLMRAQNVAVARSQAWNAAMAAAEAGVEEALAHLNPGAAALEVNRSANGWGDPDLVAGFYGPQTRTLVAGSQYSVKFTSYTPLTITSTGSVTVAAIPATLTRVVQVVATSVPLFTTALAAKYNITMSGNTVYTDSFDSGNPAWSTNGQYVLNRASTNGDVASLYGFVNVGNADIHGDLYLGTNGSYGINNNGSISGKIYKDFNVDFPDVVMPVPPRGGWRQDLPGGITNDSTTYTYGFTNANTQSGDSGYYSIPSHISSFSVYVGPNVKVRLQVTANSSTLKGLRVAGGTTDSGNLVIYSTGSSLTVGGNTRVDSGSATNFSLFGTTTTAAINLNGDSSFIGTIYAPSATLTLSGGGKSGDPTHDHDHDNDNNANYGFMGASVSKSVQMNGHYNFHFDENLLRGQFQRGFLVTSWREL